MAVGDPLPALPITQTFYDDFSSGQIFVDQGGKWCRDTYGGWDRETNINSEHQYYISRQDAANYGFTPWFINGAGNLVLRMQETSTTNVPPNVASVVLESYQTVQQYSAGANSIEVQGINFNEADGNCGTISGVGVNNKRVNDMFAVLRNGQNLEVNNVINLSNGNAVISFIGSTNIALKAGERVQIRLRQPYVSGMLTTQDCFSQTQGRWRVRVKFPGGKHLFPAAWLWPDWDKDTDPQPTATSVVTNPEAQKNAEIDITEILGHDTSIFYQTLHGRFFNSSTYWNTTPSANSNFGGTVQTFPGTDCMIQTQVIDWGDRSARFYDYYIDWYCDNTVRFFAEHPDGTIKETARHSLPPQFFDGVIDPHYTILNFAVQSKWSEDQFCVDMNRPNLITTTPQQADFEIAEVEAWQFDDCSLPPEGGNPPTETPRSSQWSTPGAYGSIPRSVETKVGPPGTINDVVFWIDSCITSRQGSIIEVEAHVAYHPSNIPIGKIGFNWSLSPTANVPAYFIDGSNKQRRARIHLATASTARLANREQIGLTIAPVLLP